MIKKNQYIEQVRRRLCGGEPTADLLSRYHPLLVAKEIDTAYESLLQSLFIQNLKFNNFSVLDPYTKPFIVSISYDSTLDEFYSNLPVPIVVLSSPNTGTGNYGIRMISSKKGQQNQFVPIDNNADNIFAHLEVGTIGVDPSYYAEGNQVRYNFRSLPFQEGDEVLMKLIPTFSSMGDEDYVTMPEVMTKNGMFTVSDRVYSTLVGMPPEKMYNDNTSKQV